MAQIETVPNGSTQTPGAIGITADTLYDKCVALARNLWWSWHPEVINLFRDLDPIRWRQLDHNPIALLSEFTAERLEMRAAELVLYSRINHAYRRLKEYVATTPLWGRTHTGVLGSKPVAYFSLEFGVHESVPVYSGGLGVLSGDHIKSASALGVPLVAIGLFYDQGYFKQHLDADGWQQEEYLNTKVETLPMEPARGPDGKPVKVEICTRTGCLLVKVWLMRVGRVKLYLLDCDVPSNSPEDRELTSRLYGGDNRTRIRQELVAGVGGIRALTALGISPGVYHLNEGHSAFATLEAIRVRMKDDGMSFDDALRDVAQHTVFTTHTPVPAGHDRFDSSLIEEHLGPLRDELGISAEQLMGLGRVEPQNEPEALAAGKRREQPPRPRHPTNVGAPLALARRGGDPHRPHHQRRTRRKLAGLADAAALRPPLPRRLDAKPGRARGLGGDPRRGSGRVVGDALHDEKPPVGLCPSARQSPVPTPRRK
jgi:starch phosphorylase